MHFSTLEVVRGPRVKQRRPCDVLRVEAERVLGVVLFVSCSLNTAETAVAAAGRPCACMRGVMATFGPGFFFFVMHLWKKVDFSETFRPCRGLRFILVQHRQGNSNAGVKQRAERGLFPLVRVLQGAVPAPCLFCKTPSSYRLEKQSRLYWREWSLLWGVVFCVFISFPG